MAQTIHDQITQLAGELKNSALTEGFLFEKFIEEYFDKGSVRAFSTLHKSGASKETCELASQFISHAHSLNKQELEKNLNASKAGLNTQQIEFLTSFCRDFSIHGDHQRAMNKYNKRLDFEEPFASDPVFKETFSQMAEKFKPKKVVGYEVSVEPDDGLIFNLRYNKVRTEQPLKTAQAKELLGQYIVKAFKGNITKEEVRGEVDILYKTRKPSLALQLAFSDVSSQYSKLRKVSSELEKNRNLVSSYNIPLYLSMDEKKEDIVKDAPVISASARVNVMRDIIKRLNEGKPVKDVLKDAITEIAKFEDLDAFSRLKKEEKQESNSLLGVLHRHTGKLSSERTRQVENEMLLESYSCYLPVNKAEYWNESMKEVQGLAQGQSNILISKAMNEYNSSVNLLSMAVAMNNKVNYCITAWRKGSQESVQDKVFKKFQVEPASMSAAPAPEIFVEKGKDRGYSVHNN